MYEYRQLGRADAPAIHNHFLSMSAEDRRSRFRQTVNDESLLKYANSLNFLRDAFIGCFFEHCLVGIAQINMYSDKDFPVGELALSVDAAHRRAGVGEALIHYMKAYVRLRGIVEFSLTTTKCNKAMVALARKIGSEPFEEDGEVGAKIVINQRDDRYAMRKSSLPEFKIFENTNEEQTKLVVMLHGARGDAWQWRQFLVPDIVDNDYGVYALGIKWSDIGKTVDAIEKICNDSGKQITLVGHSIGGLLAQSIAMRGNVARLERLVLVCALPLHDKKLAISSALAHVDHEAREDLAHADLHDFGVIKDIPIGVRMISGLKDRVCLISDQRLMARRFKATLVTLQGGHNPLSGTEWPLVSRAIMA